jgi:hypothetical protein
MRAVPRGWRHDRISVDDGDADREHDEEEELRSSGIEADGSHQ